VFLLDDNLKSKVFSLIDLVDYQKDSIVSKTFINKKEGSVTFFAFDAGQVLSEHTAPFDAMINIFDGEAEITINKEKYNLSNGDMIILPANIPHAVKALKKFKMLLTMIKS
jgi:quercetin dioxygenase-like cupin family protein